jgi:hypothetical protein
MQGKLWIDKETFQWVKVIARVMHPVSIEDFLANVEPGTHFELEKAPELRVSDCPSAFRCAHGPKSCFLFPKNGQEDDTYFSYHKRIPRLVHSPSE